MPYDHQPTDSYDVTILGGGLAGLTLGHQFQQARPGSSVFAPGADEAIAQHA